MIFPQFSKNIVIQLTDSTVMGFQQDRGVSQVSLRGGGICDGELRRKRNWYFTLLSRYFGNSVRFLLFAAETDEWRNAGIHRESFLF